MLHELRSRHPGDAGAVACRRASELSLERAREHLAAPEAGVERDREYRIATGGEARCPICERRVYCFGGSPTTRRNAWWSWKRDTLSRADRARSIRSGPPRARTIRCASSSGFSLLRLPGFRSNSHLRQLFENARSLPSGTLSLAAGFATPEKKDYGVSEGSVPTRHRGVG